jgi:hypothetical protein
MPCTPQLPSGPVRSSLAFFLSVTMGFIGMILVFQSGLQGIGDPTPQPFWHRSARVYIIDSDLVKRHRGRVTADDEASGASPRRG